MEDSFIILHDLQLHPDLPISIYGVLDGHGGEWCATFIRQLFEEEIRKNLLDPVHGIYGTERKGMNECIELALKTTFFNIDEAYFKIRYDVAGKCGSTAVLVLMIGKHVFCANVGDSRGVLCRNGKAVNLSLDHKVSRPDETKRINNIKDSKWNVEFGRVGG